MNNAELQKEFQYVRKAFFPHWDLKRTWKVVVADDLNGADGECKWDDQIIMVLRTAETIMREILIHEICHALTECGHGHYWGKRMEQCANKAESLGQTSLAQDLRDSLSRHTDLTRYTIPCECEGKLTAKLLYSDVEDILISNRSISFEMVCVILRERWSLGPKGLNRYKRLRRVYDEAKSFSEADRKFWLEIEKRRHEQP
jgi:hypothetical protein